MCIVSGQSELKVLQAKRPGLGCSWRAGGGCAGVAEMGAPELWFLVLAEAGEMQGMALLLQRGPFTSAATTRPFFPGSGKSNQA